MMSMIWKLESFYSTRLINVSDYGCLIRANWVSPVHHKLVHRSSSCSTSTQINLFIVTHFHHRSTRPLRSTWIRWEQIFCLTQYNFVNFVHLPFVNCRSLTFSIRSHVSVYTLEHTLRTLPDSTYSFTTLQPIVHGSFATVSFSVYFSNRNRTDVFIIWSQKSEIVHWTSGEMEISINVLPCHDIYH